MFSRSQNSRWTAGAFLGFWLLAFFGCANQILQYDKADHLVKMDEFESHVKIVEAPTATELIKAPEAAVIAPPAASKKKKVKKTKNPKVEDAPTVVVHEPSDVEGTEGFVGRRPLQDPFRVGEKIVHQVSYFGVDAVRMTMEVLPFAIVNGKKSYQIQFSASSLPFFSHIYKIEDSVVSMLDFETLIPSVLTYHQRETKQLKEARAYFDRATLQASYWEKKVVDGEPEKEEKKQWEMLDYSQNVFSAPYYMRAFIWKAGDEHQFRVTDDGQNLIFKAKALRVEKIKVPAGEFETLVIKPEVELRGAAKPVGDIMIWMTNDDRHLIIKIEAKIKIGTLVSEAVEIQSGHE